MRKRLVWIGFTALSLAWLGIGIMALTHRQQMVERNFLLACMHGDAATVHRLLSDGIDPNAIVRPDDGDDVGWWIHETIDAGDRKVFRVPAVLAAARANRLDIVDDLLLHGANPNFRDGAGGSALIEAVQHKNVQMIRHLMDHGADPTLAWKDGTTPLDVADSPELKALLTGAKSASAN